MRAYNFVAKQILDFSTIVAHGKGFYISKKSLADALGYIRPNISWLDNLNEMLANDGLWAVDCGNKIYIYNFDNLMGADEVSFTYNSGVPYEQSVVQLTNYLLKNFDTGVYVSKLHLKNLYNIQRFTVNKFEPIIQIAEELNYQCHIDDGCIYISKVFANDCYDFLMLPEIVKQEFLKKEISHYEETLRPRLNTLSYSLKHLSQDKKSKLVRPRHKKNWVNDVWLDWIYSNQYKIEDVAFNCANYELASNINKANVCDQNSNAFENAINYNNMSRQININDICFYKPFHSAERRNDWGIYLDLSLLYASVLDIDYCFIDVNRDVTDFLLIHRKILSLSFLLFYVCQRSIFKHQVESLALWLEASLYSAELKNKIYAEFYLKNKDLPENDNIEDFAASMYSFSIMSRGLNSYGYARDLLKEIQKHYKKTYIVDEFKTEVDMLDNLYAKARSAIPKLVLGYDVENDNILRLLSENALNGYITLSHKKNIPLHLKGTDDEINVFFSLFCEANDASLIDRTIIINEIIGNDYVDLGDITTESNMSDIPETFDFLTRFYIPSQTGDYFKNQD